MLIMMLCIALPASSGSEVSEPGDLPIDRKLQVILTPGVFGAFVRSDAIQISATTIATTTFLSPFAQDYSSEPIPEETFTHSHLS